MKESKNRNDNNNNFIIRQKHKMDSRASSWELQMMGAVPLKRGDGEAGPSRASMEALAPGPRAHIGDASLCHPVAGVSLRKPSVLH